MPLSEHRYASVPDPAATCGLQSNPAIFQPGKLNVQLDQDFADSFDFDVLDPIKLIPEEVLPPKPIGRLVLNRMPDNFFAETEQVAFMTQNVPPVSTSQTIRYCKAAISPISIRN